MPVAPEYLLVLLLLAVILGMNARATWLVLCDEVSEPSQRVMQLVLVWLLPVLGALMVFAVHRPPEKASGKYREPYELDEDPAFPGLGGRGARDRSPDDGDDDD